MSTTSLSVLRLGLLAGVSACSVLAPLSSARAQAAPQAGETAPAPQQTQTNADDAPTLGDIVVTANKREQSLKDVGLTITALSGAQLTERHVSSLDDLTRTVPSLSFQPTAFATPVFTLRGIGFFDSSLSSYPAVATYIDETPLPFPMLTTHMAFDLERLEALKGPQGTLFGASSTGGAINFIARKPTNTFEAGGDVTYGRFNRVELNGYISGPLTSTLSARLSVNAARSDDWQYSQTRPNDTSGKTKYVAGRAIILWEPSSALKVTLSANGYKDDSDTVAPQFRAFSPQRSSTGTPGFAAFPFAPDNARVADWEPDLAPSGRQSMEAGSGRIDWNIFGGATLTSITSYAHYSRNVNTEQDGTPFIAGDYTLTGWIKTFNQEVRLGNSPRNKFRWIVGGNYEHTNTFEFFEDFFPDISSSVPGPPFFDYTGIKTKSNQYLRNYAGFANVELDLGRQITLRGGLRYTENRRRQTECTFDPGDGSYSRVINFVGPRLAGRTAPFIPITGTQCGELNDVVAPSSPEYLQSAEFDGTLNQHNLSWRVGADYKPSRDVLLYLNIAKGSKAGTFPFIGGTNFAIHNPVTQESLLDYEGGFKIQLLDRTLSLNGAAFYYDYDDKQLRSRIPDRNFGAFNALISVPKSHLYGFELEAAINPTQGLSLTESFSFIKSKIDEYTGFPASGIPPAFGVTTPTNFAGSPLPYLPTYQVNSTIDYKWDVGSVRPFVGATLSFRSSQYTTIGGSKGIQVQTALYRSDVPLANLFKIPAYALVDLRAGIAAGNGSWSVSVFGKNVLNEYYFTNILPAYDNVVSYAGMPATYGITFGVKFR
ncbi:TonB-dependent receptor plug domain-containing protein [Sphingomonas histidinilytica]|uniref:TonB-dependent receptor n=1 Tax=Rhizorhabdus histidinilytica TaxID=439228 RepID=UPI001ADC8E64|nr:TonB-dependent receptor [Rhizorhabdus histidinilytica]MBO9378814.1 TonB-dependent receptor plug domain-containing protein [Rhizorhabdus histidinilytica]